MGVHVEIIEVQKEITRNGRGWIPTLWLGSKERERRGH